METPDAPASALDVLRTVDFTRSMRGYSPDEVDEFLERAAVESERLKDQMRQQKQQLRQAAERISQLESDRRGAPASAPPRAVEPVAAPMAPVPVAAIAAPAADQVTKMIAMAQQFVDQTQREAELRARELTAAAQEKAREIVVEAQSRAQDEVTRLNGLKQRLSEDVDKLARQVDQERARLRNQLHEFLRWVDETLQSPNAQAVAAAAVVAPVPAPPTAVPPPLVERTTPPKAPATASTASLPSPPPARPREAPTTIGQVLHFDGDDRS